MTEDVLHRVNVPIEPALQRPNSGKFYRSQINDIFSAEDWVTTLVAAAGEQNTLLRALDFRQACQRRRRMAFPLGHRRRREINGARHGRVFGQAVRDHSFDHFVGHLAAAPPGYR